MAADGAMQKLVNIFTSPAEAFRALREKPTFLLPLAALIVANCVVVLWYYSVVDIVWLIETTLEASAANIPADQREQLLENMSRVSPMVAGGSAAVASGFVVLILLLLAAGYLSLVSLFANDGFRFRHWFSLVSWSSFPVVLALLASMVNIAVGDATHLPAERLNPLSFASLLDLEAGGPGLGARFAQYTDPTSLWALALMIIGYRQWTGKSLGTSALIVAGPLLVIVVLVLAASML